MTASATLFSPSSRTAPQRLRSVDLAGPAGRLEAVLNEGTATAQYAALVCHPHPLGGGTLHNKVVFRAMKVLNAPEWDFGWPVLRFNFRGTGRSQGVHDGAAESGDVTSALAWLEKEFRLPIVVAGFSFGAAMALKACCGSCANGAAAAADVRALIALGLPTHVEGRDYSYPFLQTCATRKLFLSGTGDQYAPLTELQQVVADASEPKQMVLLPGADHFFTRQLEPMQRALAGWLKEQVL